MADLIINDQSPRASKTVGATPSSGPFNFNFEFFAEAEDIRVFDGDTELTYSATPSDATEFSVTGTAADDYGFEGGSVTLGGTVANTTITIVRDLPIERLNKFPTPSTTLDIGELNKTLDRLFAMMQERRSDYDRVLRQPDSDAADIDALPNVAARAGKILGFKSDGNTEARDIPTWRAGSGAPAGSLGSDGDMYLDTATDEVYGPKASGAWGAAVTDLTGATGAAGANGADGTDGADGKWSGAEATVTPQTGDKVAIEDVSDSENPKFATVQSILDLQTTGVDEAARSDIRLHALKIAALDGDRINMVDGIADPFADETDVDTATSSNEVFVAAETHYHPTRVTEGTDPSTTSSGLAGFTAVDRSYALDNNETVSAVEIYYNQSGSENFGLKIVENTSGAVYDVDHDEDVVHSSGGWETFTLSSPFTVPASGTFHVAIHQNDAGTVDITGNISRGTKSGDTTGIGQSFTHDTGPVIPTRVTYDDVKVNLTLVSNAFTADAQPDTGRIHIQVKENEAVTVNTDLTAEISRDGGTTWTAATLVKVADLADGTVAYEDNEIDISGQPAGTSMKYRIKTLNTKDIEVHGVILQWA